MFRVLRDKDGTPQICAVGRQPRGSKNVKVEVPFKDFVAGLTETVAEYIPDLVFRTMFRKDGVIYRGTAHYGGGVWRDWVIVDWYGSDGKLPNKIWGFVDLRELPPDNELEYGGLYCITPGVYAIVENAVVVRARGEVGRSELFIPITKDVGKMEQNRVVELKFYLANVEDFVEPIAVIPDIGGPANAYLALRRRREWREDFITWLLKGYEKFEDFEEDDDENEEDDDKTEEDADDSEQEEEEGTSSDEDSDR